MATCQATMVMAVAQATRARLGQVHRIDRPLSSERVLRVVYKRDLIMKLRQVIGLLLLLITLAAFAHVPV